MRIISNLEVYYLRTIVVDLKFTVNQPFVFQLSKFRLTFEIHCTIIDIQSKISSLLLVENIYEIWIHHQISSIYRYLGDKVDFDRFFGWCLFFINFFLTIVNYELSLNNFDHKFKSTTMLSLLVQNMRGVIEEELVRFEIYNSIVQSLKFLYFITIFMLTNRLKMKTLLTRKNKFDW